MSISNERLSYTVEEALAVTGLTRTAFYKAVNTQQLITFKSGKRRMVSARALQDFIAAKEKEATRGVAA